MKTPLFSLLLLAALLVAGSGCAGTIPLARPLPGEIAVSRFTLDVEGLEADFPDQGGGLVPVASRILQDARDVVQAARTIAHPEDSPYLQVVHGVYDTFVDASAGYLGLRVLPIDTLRGEVPYYVGLPFGDTREVAQSGRYGGVMEVEAYVTVPDAGQSSWSILGIGKARVKGHPEMLLRVRLMDASGAVVWRDHVRVRSKEKVELSERWVLGIRTDRDVTSPMPTLPDLMDEAIARLARRLPQQP